MFMRRVGCFLTSLFERNVGGKLSELLCGKYFLRRCLRDGVGMPMCSLASIERRKWRSGIGKNLNV